MLTKSAIAAIGMALCLSAAAEDLPTIKPLTRVGPRVPEFAMRYGQPGEARVRATIDANGNLTDVALLSDLPAGKGFGEAAVESVEKWTFPPGKPGSYSVTVKFLMLEPSRARAKSGGLMADAAPPAPAPSTYVKPVYPLLAQEKRLEGTARLFVKLWDGHVREVAYIDEPQDEAANASIFVNEAYYAVSDWRFDESLNGGYIVTVPFTLDGLAKGQFDTRPRERF